MIPTMLIEEIIRIHAELRKKGLMRRKTRITSRPVNFWIETEPFRENGEIVNLPALTIIFGTVGCRWARSKTGGCIMCGYLYQNPLKGGDLLAQLNFALKKVRNKRKEIKVVKIFTSGSFIDEEEVPQEIQIEILERLCKSLDELKIIEIETRPEFINEDILTKFEEFAKKYKIKLCFNIGLESANDDILRLINKGFSSRVFFDALKKLQKHGFLAKTYLLFKPPFMTEYEAIQDVITSAKKAFNAGTYFVSINPMVIFSWTFIEYLWRNKLYRPPTLESVIFVTNEVLKLNEAKKGIVICSPVAPGLARGPHALKRNTDRKLLNILNKIVKSQAPIDVPPENKELWEEFIRIEETTHDLGLSEFRY